MANFKGITVRTIEQLKILQWLQENFYEEGICSVNFLSQNTVEITDIAGDHAVVSCINDAISLL